MGCKSLRGICVAPERAIKRRAIRMRFDKRMHGNGNGCYVAPDRVQLHFCARTDNIDVCADAVQFCAYIEIHAHPLRMA